MSRPSGWRVSCQPPSWTARWWARQSRARLARSVGPPWSQWRRWWASHQAQGSGAVGEDTAAVAHGQGGALGGLDDPGGPSDLQWLGGGAAQGRGQQGHGGSESGRQPVGPARVVGFWWCLSVRVVGGRWCLAAGVVAGVVVARVLAGDQHPGHRPVTRQSSAGLGVQRPGPADLPTHRPGVAKQAVQVHDHAQLRADPTGLGQPPTLQAAAGQLGQGISVALAAAAGVVGVGRAGQRFQGGQQGLAGLGFQQPIDGDHALEGRGQPQPAAVHDGAPGRDPRRQGRRPGAGGPRSRRSRPGSSRRAASTSTGSASTVTWSGRSLGAGGDHLGVGDRQLPIAHRLGGLGQRSSEQGPGGPDMAGWPPGRSDAAGSAARPRSTRPPGRLRRRRPRGRRPRRVP